MKAKSFLPIRVAMQIFGLALEFGGISTGEGMNGSVIEGFANGLLNHREEQQQQHRRHHNHQQKLKVGTNLLTFLWVSNLVQCLEFANKMLQLL
jgi:hypothetical protein